MSSAFDAIKAQLISEKTLLKYSYGNNALDPWITDQLARLISLNGTDDLRDITPFTESVDFCVAVEDSESDIRCETLPVTLYYNRKTGLVFENIGGIDATSQDYHDVDVFASTNSKDYWVYFLIRFAPDGTPYFLTRLQPIKKSRGFFGDLFGMLAPVLGIALSIFVPGLGSAIGSAVLGSSLAASAPLLATAIGNTAISAALNGGDIERAVIGSVAGIGGGFTGGLVQNATESALLASATAAATSAAIVGGDLKMAVAGSLLSTGARNMGDLLFPESADVFAHVDPVFDVAFEPDYGDMSLVPGGAPQFDPSIFADAGESVPADFYNAFGSGYQISGGTGLYGDPGSSIFGSQFVGFDMSGFDNWGNTNLPAVGGSLPNVPPASPSDGWGQVTGAVDALTAMAVAAIKVNMAWNAARNPGVVRPGQIGSDGSVTTANRNGTVTTRRPNGAISTAPGAVGVPYALGDGSTMINNGNGTYSIIAPSGATTTGRYSASAGGGDLFAGLTANKPLMYGALAVGALLLLRK